MRRLTLTLLAVALAAMIVGTAFAQPGRGMFGGGASPVQLIMNKGVQEELKMTDEQKEIVRIEAFWIDTWLKAHYKGIENVYIIHDAAAQIVDEHTFYHTRESGGTKISSAYELADKLITQQYPPDQWNVYAFHFSDGDNWGDDVPKCVEILTERLLPKVERRSVGITISEMEPSDSASRGFISSRS